MSALHDYLAALEQLPGGSLVPVSGLVAELRVRLDTIAHADDAPAADVAAAPTWRERLWLVPPETRLGVVELAEALGRPKSWVYRRTGPASEHTPLPCRKLDGELIFVAGEIRAWITASEAVVHGPPAPLPTPTSAPTSAPRVRALRGVA